MKILQKISLILCSIAFFSSFYSKTSTPNDFWYAQLDDRYNDIKNEINDILNSTGSMFIKEDFKKLLRDNQHYYRRLTEEEKFFWSLTSVKQIRQITELRHDLFLTAAEAGHCELLTKLIHDGIDVNTQSEALNYIAQYCYGNYNKEYLTLLVLLKDNGANGDITKYQIHPSNENEIYSSVYIDGEYRLNWDKTINFYNEFCSNVNVVLPTELTPINE
jgi:hypothetical protein